MNQKLNKKVAFLDIDGTLLKGQMQRGLVSFFRRKGLISFVYYIKLSIWFTLYKLSLTGNNMRGVFDYGLHYLGGKKDSYISVLIDEFIKDYLSKNEYRGSRLLVNTLLAEGFSVILVSTAIDLVVGQVANYYGINNYICTRLEKKNGIYTGRVEGDIIYGGRKQIVIKSYCEANEILLKDCVAYADHLSDFPLLKSVGIGYVTNPNSKLFRLAQKDNLKVAYTY